MLRKKDAPRQHLDAALAGTSPVGAQLVNSLGQLVLGSRERTELALPTAGEIGTPGSDINAQLNGWSNAIDQSIRRPARIGVVMMAVFVVGLGAWATTAPLASAVVARGSFVATGQNKIVQHLEGGIIRQILVNEGDRVEAGQALMELDDTTSRADEQRLSIKQASLLATKARLDAEREGASEIVFAEALIAMSQNPEVAKSVQAQRSLFASRREEFAAQRDINERQIGAIQQEITGLRAQMASSQEQLGLVAKETDTAEKLLAKGLADNAHVLDLRRNKTKLAGDIGQIMSEIGKAEQRILETKNELIHQHSKIVLEAADLYRETTAELSDTEQRLTAARGILSRHIIRAPSNGVIVKMNYHTAGGVIPPSQVVMEILPTDEKLLVEAMVRPEEIDFVHAGQQAEIRLSALNQRTTPLVLGNVLYVSADKIQNQNARTPGEAAYYIARVELDDASVKERIGKLKIAPGMPAEVYMKTGERTMWQYLTRPIVDSMYRGAREQ
jgi:HlyD family secretion protein